MFDVVVVVAVMVSSSVCFALVFFNLVYMFVERLELPYEVLRELSKALSHHSQ